MPLLHNIGAIIFDIGNVLIDIDYEVMITAFQPMAAIDFHSIVTYSYQDLVFDRYEKGQISTAGFRDALRGYLQPGVTDQDIDSAWNSMLIHFPAAKFDMLKDLRKRYKLFALSNINDLHASAIDARVEELFGADMRSYFDHAYYSHEMGYRKPEKEIYRMVLHDAGIDPSHTLFIDDKRENVDAAASLGIRVHHLTDRNALPGLLAQ